VVSTACADGALNERGSPPRHSLGLMNKKRSKSNPV
jgi:hypothetical protein